MYAVEADLGDPKPILDNPEWFEFDVAVISMALHHVADPTEMLRRLQERLKKGGALVVVEWLQTGTPGESQTGDRSHEQLHHHHNHKSASTSMIETIGGQKI